MADMVTKQELEAAKIDVKHAGEAVNTKKVITPRYGAPFKSLPLVAAEAQAKADEIVAQGFYKGYTTEALLLAAKPTVSEMRARADDTRKIWRWNRTSAEGVTPVTGTWTDTGLSDKELAINYADNTKTSKETVDNNVGQSQILVLSDNEGNVVLHIDDAGSVFLAGEATSLQKQLTVNQIVFNDVSTLTQSQDINGDAINIQTPNGDQFIPNLKFSIQDEFARLKSVNRVQSTILGMSDDARVLAGEAIRFADSQISEISNLKVLAAYSETNTVQRIASILKVDENTILYVWGGGVAGYSGDGEGVKLYKKLLKVGSDFSVTAEEDRVLIASPTLDSGVSKHPMLGKTSTGRIILAYDERDNLTETYRQYVRFSDDGGATFTTKTQIPHHPELTGVIVAIGSTGQILTTNTGRLLLPFYSVGNNSWICYSDDNGVTWTHGNLLPNSGGEPTICFDKNGHILMSLRDDNAAIRTKILAKSIDNGVNLELIGHNTDLSSNPCASTLLYDADFNVVFHGTPKKNLHGSTRRFKYQIQMSFDNGETFPIAFQPFDDEYYIGYSQIIKLSKGVYAVAVEGLTYAVGTNSKESAGIYIFNLKEAFQKCR